MAECNHGLTYEKRSGTDNKGGEYEVHLTALFAIKLVLDWAVYDVQMAPNVNKYGAFDDVVIRVQYRNGTTMLYLLQLKHKEDYQKPVEFINKRNGDFSLEKYKNSYCEDIEKRITRNEQDHLLKDLALSDVVPCLFTNAVSPKDTNDLIIDKRASLSCKALRCSNVDFIETTPGGYHIFQMCTERPSFTQFLNSYLFAGYQKGYEDTIKKIEGTPEVIVKRIGSRFREILKTKIKDDMNFDEILKSVRESVKGSFTKVESALLEEILKKVSDYFNLEYQSAQDVYAGYSSRCAEYSEFFQRFRFYGGQLNCDQVIEAITARIEESLGKCDVDIVKKFIQYVREYFKHDHLLVKQQIQRKLLELMLAPPLPKEDFEKRFQVFRKITNLNDPIQKLLISQHVRVSFQGRKEFGLWDIVDSNYCRTLKPEFLVKHIGGVIKVGKILELKCENYIKREFRTVTVKRSIFGQCKNCVFIVSVSKGDDLVHEIQNKVTIIDLRNGQNISNDFTSDWKNSVILISNEGDVNGRAETLMKLITVKADTVHYLNEINNSLEWKGSRNKPNSKCIRFTKEFFGTKPKGVPEEDLLQYFKITPVNIISAMPGMGKSTVLDSLIQYCPSNKWVLKLSLNECNDDLLDKFEEILDDPLQYMYEKFQGDCQDEFSKEIFDYMKNKNAVVAFIDAFDEISPDYTDKVLKIIRKLEQLEVHTWVFTRPSIQEFLENNLNTAAIEILPLREDEIEDYLLKCIKNNEPSLERFLEKMIDFMKIPLHLNMFSIILGENLNWNELEVTDLYENFITTKCHTYYKKFGINLNINCILQVVNFENMIKDHQILSLLLIYGEDFLLKNDVVCRSDIDRLLLEIKKYKNHVGLVSAIHGSTPIFCHKSFAEYLTAKWLSSNTNHKSFKPLCESLFKYNFKGDKIFDEYENVRFFFNKIITREYPLHAAVVDQNVELVQKLCGKSGLVLCDVLNRTPLHIAVTHFKYYANTFEEECKRNEVALKITNAICEHFANTKAFMDQKDWLGQQWHTYFNSLVTSSLDDHWLFLTACYWGCKAIVMMFMPKTVLIKFHFTKLNFNIFKVVVKRGHVDCLKLLLLCGPQYNIEKIKELAATYSQQEMVKLLNDMAFTTESEKSESLRKYFEPELVYAMKFLTLNEELLIDKGPPSCFGSHVYIKSEIFGNILLSEQVVNKFFEDTKKKFVTNFGNNLEELEGKFNILSIREELNILGRIEMMTTMQLSGCTPLCAAALRGYLNVFKIIASTSDNINANPGDKFSPLHCAIEGGNNEIIHWLIEAGADVNQVDCDGVPALLHYYKKFFGKFRPYTGTEINQLDVLRLLIDKGADATAKSAGGESCLGLAIKNHNHDINVVPFLIERGAHVDHRDNDSQYTALQAAISLAKHSDVKYFLNEGAHVNIQIGGKTSLDLALSMCVLSKDWSIVLLLMKRKADISYFRQDLRIFAFVIREAFTEKHSLAKYLLKRIDAETIISTISNQPIPYKLSRDFLIFDDPRYVTTTRVKASCDYISKVLNKQRERRSPPENHGDPIDFYQILKNIIFNVRQMEEQMNIIVPPPRRYFEDVFKEFCVYFPYK